MIATLQAAFERASSAYAETYAIDRDPDWFVLKLVEEMGELTQAWNKFEGRSRPHGRSEDELRLALADETADLLGHVLLFAGQSGIDLNAAIERKWRFRPDDLRA
ncbi:pyrophosphatase [Mesorhizobium sp. BR1-1-16]|uniref:MazG nucleotide pyrophosphohydrolase domain-containing protein n=1 Tax=Mesorhizobium sp. BR1-1-16 TaxID=2876653 RepID=UPI001CC8F9F1|nr:MazG nucleotide pyrophosphohydrolase domain-containing protein [Mesorhizobium sp. BR1-1-16]MBZ9935825.1 pyrophosphatase [Mesorhizobium sp. BR1-1-16]